MKLNSIQFLRAVAALLVVYEHSMDVTNRYGASWQQKFYYLDNFGCIGVDLFFVISGFIITYVANKYIGATQGLQFLAKRFVRINPVYYIATLFFLGAYLLQLQANKIPLASSFNQTMSSLMDTILIVPTADKLSSFSPLLSVGWTLSFEWLFYILFFLLILCNIKRKTLFLPGLILSLIVVGQLLKPKDLRIQFITNPIMLEFILGVIICQLHFQVKKIPVWIGTILLSLGVISYLLLIRLGYGNVWYYLDAISGNSSINKFMLWGIPSGCIVAGCVFLERNGKLNKLWNNKWALLGGDASYSIYLIHYTILNLLTLLYMKTGFFLPADAMIWLQLIVAVLISIWFYKLVEKPLLIYMHRSSLWDLFTAKTKKKATNPDVLGERVNPLVN